MLFSFKTLETGSASSSAHRKGFMFFFHHHQQTATNIFTVRCGYVWVYIASRLVFKQENYFHFYTKKGWSQKFPTLHIWGLIFLRPEIGLCLAQRKCFIYFFRIAVGKYHVPLYEYCFLKAAFSRESFPQKTWLFISLLMNKLWRKIIITFFMLHLL